MGRGVRSDSATGDGNAQPAGKRQFSLALLMAWVFAACVLFGALHLVFDQSLSVTLKILLALAGWGVAVGIFAALGHVKTVVEWGMLIGVGLIIMALLMPAVTYSCRTRPRCAHNLNRIAAAMLTYELKYESLPPPFIADEQGKPMHSWRVLILPELGEQALYDQYRFDEPWDGPNNKKLHNRIIDVYRCPSDHPHRRSAAARETSYVVIVGPHTAFPGGRKRISIADFFGDGASNTILVAEVHSSGIHWMEPRDLNFAEMDFQINGKQGPSISSAHPDGVMAAMADGSVRFIEEKMRPEAVKKLIQVNDGTPTEEDL